MMKALTLLGIMLSVSLSTAVTAGDLVEDHERAERAAELRGRGAAEQAARMAAESPVALETHRAGFSGEEARLVLRVREAKQAGDREAILRAEQELAAYRGKSLETLAVTRPAPGGPLQAAARTADPGQGRWLPHEFLLAGERYREARPTLASDAAGNLYAAFETGTEESGHECKIYRSSDGGEHWQEIFWIWGADIISPSIAVAEGDEDWLFVAFHVVDNQTIYVLRQSLHDPAVWDLTTILENPLGVANPRIVTDCSEFAGWYAYLVYNALGVDNWVILHNRTLDYGDTWSTPEIVAGYCGYPGQFYDASEAHPDIEYGSDNLYIAFDNYPPPCTSTTRDIFLLTSEDYGETWGDLVRLTSDADDEHDPAVAAVKNYFTNPTTVVAYTRFWDELDDDVWYRATQDDGVTWSYARCISCTLEWEKDVNLVTSYAQGSIHAAFWSEYNIDYAGAEYTDPLTWSRQDSISTLNTACDIGYRPGILVDPTQATSAEVGIAWTDFRYETATDLDIYYDAGALPRPPDDFYLYLTHNPGLGIVTGIDGFVDDAGAIEGNPGAEYIFFEAGDAYEGDHTAYVYRVETAGDPDMHPDNPVNPGPIAPRTLTFVNSHYLGHYASGHDNAFYIDETGIYYGASDNPRNGVPGWGGYMDGGIFHWDFAWNLLGCVVPTPAPPGTQTLARNARTGDWWVATAARQVYKWDGGSWVYQFIHPELGGSHHDGMEIINNSLFISDMTSDVIIQYRLDDAGNPIDAFNQPCNTFFYSATPSVEGLGFEPNHHIWIAGYASHVIYEIGGGALQLAFEGIPDQCVLPGDSFEPFDLDDYVTGVPPFSWSWEGNVELTVDVGAGNVVTVTYPPGWIGQETITFTVEDGLGTLASDDATFTVSQVPVVGDIPDQTAPFTPFDLDDYLSGALSEMVTWTASGMSCLQVAIDPVTHVATVTDPGGCSDPEEITFTATVVPCGEMMSDSDGAVFDPGFSGVAEERGAALRSGSAMPNPSAVPIEIHYTIPRKVNLSAVTLVVHDISGRVVRSLIKAGDTVTARTLTWDGNDDQGMPLPSGTYYFRLRWEGKQATQGVMLLR